MSARWLVAVVTAVLPLIANAEDYPSRPGKWVVPFPSGSSTDLMGREVSQMLFKSLDKSFVLYNRPGAQATLGSIEVSMVDAANPCVFLDAKSLGLSGTEMPEELERNIPVIARLHAIGAQASVVMGLCATFQEGFKNFPLIGLVSASRNSMTLSGAHIPANAAELCIRMLSSGQPHRALPGTGSICTAVAMRIPGTLPYRLSASVQGDPIRLAMPSGVMEVDAEVVAEGGAWHALRGSVYRTARLLFKGDVYY